MGNIDVLKQQWTDVTDRLKEARANAPQTAENVVKEYESLMNMSSERLHELREEIENAWNAVGEIVENTYEQSPMAQETLASVRSGLESLRSQIAPAGLNNSSNKKGEPNWFDSIRNSITGFFTGAGLGGAASSGLNAWESARNAVAFSAGSNLRDLREIPVLGGLINTGLSVFGISAARIDFASALRSAGFTGVTMENGSRLSDILADPKFSTADSKKELANFALKLREEYSEPQKTLSYKQLRKVLYETEASQKVEPKIEAETLSPEPPPVNREVLPLVGDLVQKKVMVHGHSASIRGSTLTVDENKRWNVRINNVPAEIHEARYRDGALTLRFLDGDGKEQPIQIVSEDTRYLIEHAATGDSASKNMMAIDLPYDTFVLRSLDIVPTTV